MTEYTTPVKILDDGVLQGNARKLDFTTGLSATVAAGTATIAATGGGGGAPTDAEYLVGAANAGLSAERVVTNTATVTWDLSTPGQAKANAVGGAGASWTEVEVDFGVTPVFTASFVITDAAITSSAVKMVLLPCGKAATGRTPDDWETDGAMLAANPGTGSATCYAVFSPGPIVGPRRLQYQVVA